MGGDRLGTIAIGIIDDAMAKRLTQKSWNLQKWRKKKNLSQEKLAADIGVTQGFISQIENDESDFSRSLLEALAKRLGCEPADLLAWNPDDGESPFQLLKRMPPARRRQALQILKTLASDDGE
jgi:transcriptional regulator with XRE-family HTH domain